MLAELTQHAWQYKLGGVVACTVASALYLRLVGGRLPTPATRLAVGALPLCMLNAAIPLVFCRQTEAVSIAFVAFIVTWLGSFKALAWAGGRGPLAQHPWSMLQFWALYALPILPAAAAAAGSTQPPRRQPHTAQEQQGLDSGPAHRTRHLLLRWTLKVGAAAAVVFAMQHEELLSPFAKTCLCSVGIYAMLGVVMDGPAALVLHPLRMSLSPHFLPPWESRSLAGFWGSHWNMAASNALRTAIYEPLVQGSLVKQEGKQAPPPPQQQQQEAKQGTAAPAANGAAPSGGARRRSARLAEGEAAAATAGVAASSAAPAVPARSGASGGMGGRRLAGMAASFFVSGVIHEIIMWYVSGRFTRHLSWLCFFTGQVALILGERALLAALRRRGVTLPELIRIGLTLAVLLGTGHWLFFLPAEAAGVPALFSASMRQSFAAMAAAPTRLLLAAVGRA